MRRKISNFSELKDIKKLYNSDFSVIFFLEKPKSKKQKKKGLKVCA